jgi:hypothetical protein
MDNECMICLEDIFDDTYAIISCNHVYHYKCIQHWMRTKKDLSALCVVCENPGEIVNIIEVDKSKLNNSNNIPTFYNVPLTDNNDYHRSRVSIEGNIFRQQEIDTINNNVNNVNNVNNRELNSLSNETSRTELIDRTNSNNRNIRYSCCNIL